ERVRHGRLRDAYPAHAAQRDLELDLPVRLPRREQIVESEREGRDELRLDACLGDAWPLEVGDHDVLATVLLAVEERIAERQRQLVAQLRVTDRVAVDENVAHR